MDYRNLKNHLSNLVSSGYQNQGGAGQTGTTGNYIDITKVFDKKGFTPLHFASF